MKLFVSDDTEHHSELDVNQIGKCLPREHHLTLSEEVIKRQANQTFLETTNKVSRAEFVAFDKPIKTKLPGARAEPAAFQLRALRGPFAAASSSRSTPVIDRTLFTIGTFSRPHAFVMCSTPVPPEDEYYLIACSQIFSVSASSSSRRHVKSVPQTVRARMQMPSKSPS